MTDPVSGHGQVLSDVNPTAAQSDIISEQNDTKLQRRFHCFEVTDLAGHACRFDVVEKIVTSLGMF